MKEVHRIDALEQLKLLSDPLKLGLLQVFGEAEGTVASAAEHLKEPQTKLYRHVDALLDAGLIEVTREQPKRGTVERWFRTRARRFEVAEGLLTAADPAEEERTVRELMRGAESELLQALKEDHEGQSPAYVRLRGRVSPAQYKELQARLFALLDELDQEPADDGETFDIGAVIALCRLPENTNA